MGTAERVTKRQSRKEKTIPDRFRSDTNTYLFARAPGCAAASGAGAGAPGGGRPVARSASASRSPAA